MKGFGRNLRYWGWNFEKAALWMIVFIVILGRFTITSDSMDFSSMMPLYLILMTNLIIFINVINAVNTFFPLTVSLGSTRKHSFITMQIMNHIIIMEFIASIYLSCYLLGNYKFLSVMQTYTLSFIGLFLLLLGLANIIGSVLLHFGRFIGMILYVIALLILIGIFIAIMLSSIFNVITISGSLAVFIKGPWILLLGMLVDVVTISLFGSVLKKNDLNFV